MVEHLIEAVIPLFGYLFNQLAFLPHSALAFLVGWLKQAPTAISLAIKPVATVERLIRVPAQAIPFYVVHLPLARIEQALSIPHETTPPVSLL